MHLLTRGAERFLQSLEIIGHEAPSLSCTGTTIHSKSARAATWRMSAFGGKRTLIDPHSGRPIISPVRGIGAMGYNAHNDEIRDNVKRMRRRLFTARLSAKKSAWFWPTLQNIIDWACVSVRSMIAILVVAAVPVCVAQEPYPILGTKPLHSLSRPLGRDEPHIRPGNRFADRLRVRPRAGHGTVLQ